MKFIDINDLCDLLNRVGIEQFNKMAITWLEKDFKRWHEFSMTPRHVTECPEGVIELMPCSDANNYTVKYVNGHPKNTASGKLSIVALGVLANMNDGYPKLICEMTLLTALRSAAVAALGATYLSRSDTRHVGIIGTGAQSEFLISSLRAVRPVQRVSFYDQDPLAMKKFSENFQQSNIQLLPCSDVKQVIKGVDLIFTATANRRKIMLFGYEDLISGVHIHTIGGDSSGKTELNPNIIPNCKLVVEYLEQTRMEGELQNQSNGTVYAELWEIVKGAKPGRENNEEITLFDAVGVALEDFSILTLIYQLAEDMGIGRSMEFIPTLDNPKNLFSLVSNHKPH